MPLTVIDEYRIILKRDADFWQDELELVDKASKEPIPLLDAELTIHPKSETPLPDVIWNTSNGKLSMPTTGTIRFTLSLEEIAAYAWKEGTYCLAITYTNSKRDKSFITGPVVVQNAC